MSGSTLADILADPGVGALLGAAQGFGQAAMPSRMPVPFGAVIGAGAGGALEGAQNATKMQLANQQVLAAQRQNQIGQMQMNWYKGMMPSGSSAGAQFPTSSTPTSPTAQNGSPSPSGIQDANGRYLVSPSQLVQMGNLAMASGNPEAAANFYGHAQTAAGGAGYAFGTDGRAFPTPGGAADPVTVLRKSAADKGFMPNGNGGFSPVAGTEADPNYKFTAAAATSTGTEAGKPPTFYEVPNLDANGHPVLDAQGHPTFRKQLMTAGQANSAATTGAGNPSTADPFPGWARSINAAENSTGNPSARNASGPNGTPTSTASGNGQFLEGTWPTVLRATRPDLTVGKTDAQLLGMRSDPDLALSATEQYARQNGAVLANAGLPVTGATVALAHGLGPGNAITVLKARPDAPLALLPGIAPVIKANPSYQNLTAGQLIQKYQSQMPSAPQLPGIAGMPAYTESQKPTELRQGGMRIDPMAGTVIKNPEMVKRQKEDGTFEYGHINPASPYEPEGTPGTFVPVTEAPNPNGAGGPQPQPPAASAGAADSGPARSGAPVVAQLPEDVIEGRDELGKQFFGKDSDAYESANNTQGWLNQINHAADVMEKAGSLYNTGPFAETRLGLMNGINDAIRSTGLAAPPFDQPALASAEELMKATRTAGFELASHYEGHARQAASTIQNATQSVPGISNSPLGLRLVSNGINEGAQFAIDMHNYKMDRYSGNDPYNVAAPGEKGKKYGSGLVTSETDFMKAFPSRMYSDRAISTVTPIKITDPKKLTDYLPGTFITDGKTVDPATGKLMVKQIPARDGAPPIPGYLRNTMVITPNAAR